MTGNLIAVDDLVVEYSSGANTVRPLDGFSMRAAAGQVVAVVGPSGSGKTTLLSVLSAMLPATSGSVIVGHADISTLRGRDLQAYRRRTLGIVFQGFNLLPSLSAQENVAVPLLVAGTKSKVALARATEVLAEVGLADRIHHKPIQLSGGEQQRVAIARGLIADPAVLLADEPTANLDRASAESVVRLLQRLRDRNRTIVIATHDERVLPAADKIVTMQPEPLASVPPATPIRQYVDLTTIKQPVSW